MVAHGRGFFDMIPNFLFLALLGFGFYPSYASTQVVDVANLACITDKTKQGSALSVIL